MTKKSYSELVQIKTFEDRYKYLKLSGSIGSQTFGFDRFEKILIHHMNPITIEDISNNPEEILNPEYLISVSLDTHNAIHYGDESIFNKYSIEERCSNDTAPWKR